MRVGSNAVAWEERLKEMDLGPLTENDEKALQLTSSLYPRLVDLTANLRYKAPNTKEETIAKNKVKAYLTSIKTNIEVMLGCIKTDFQEADDRTYDAVATKLQGGLKCNSVV